MELDTKIMQIPRKRAELWHIFIYNGGHFEKQDGRHTWTIFVTANECGLLKNIDLDTKIMFLRELELQKYVTEICWRPF